MTYLLPSFKANWTSNHPPVYCECAEGYEDRRKYVYRLHRHLYCMKDSPRGWGQLFSSVCTDFGLTRLKSDEGVFVKIREQFDVKDVY